MGMEDEMSRHTDLIDAVNDAITEEDRRLAEVFLDGFRAGLEECGCRWSGVDADLHTMARTGNRAASMCCGVLTPNV